MKDRDKTKEQLINEADHSGRLAEMRQRIAELESAEAERVRAEQALRESEETLRALLNAPTESAMLVDIDGAILAINEMAAQRLGKRADELIGLGMYDYLPPDVAASRRAQRDEVVRSGKPIRFQDERAGRYFDNSVYPVLDFAGKVTAIAVYARDITETRQAEEVLRESEARYRTLVAEMPNGFSLPEIIYDETGKASDYRFLEVNAAFEKMTGLRAADVIGKTVLQVLPQTEHHWIDSYGKLALDGNPIRFENYSREMGKYFEALAYSPQKGQFATVFTDVTERVRLEERLERLNRLKEDLLSPGSLDEKLKRTTDGVVTIFDADFARIWITRPGDRCDSGCIHAEVTEGAHVCHYRDLCLHLVASSGRYTHIDGKVHRNVPFGCYKIGRVAAGEDAKFITNDVAHDPRVHDHDWARELGLVSFAGYRLLSEAGEPMGVLALFGKHVLAPDEDALLEGLANTTSQVIQLARAEEALRESEGRYRQLVEISPVGIVVHSEGKVILVNAAGAEIVGAESPDQLIGSSVIEYVHPDVREIAIRRIQQAVSEGAEVLPSEERLLVQPNGTPVDVEASTVLFTHKDKPAMLTVIRDVSERKRIEEEREWLLAAEHQQRLLAETLAEVTLALTSQTRSGAVLDEILLHANQIVPHKTANIALLEDDILRIVRWRGYQDYSPAWEDMISQLPQQLPDWPADARAVQSREPVIIPDTQGYPHWRVVEVTSWIRSYLAVPICLGDRVLGLLRLDGDRPGQFSAEHARRLEPLANAAAIAIENARLFAETRQRADELETLRRISLQITSFLDLPTVLDTITESALNLVGATDCHIYLYDAETEALSFGVALWKDGRRDPAVETPRKAGLTATVAREGRTIVIDDAVHHPMYATPEAQEWGLQAVAGFPLKRANRVVGVFSVAFVEPHSFSEDELRVLNLLTDQAVIAIENARLVEGLEDEVAARTAEILTEKERSDTILRCVGDAITVSNLDMQIQYTNDAFTRLTGYTAQEALGQIANLVGATVVSEQVRGEMQATLAEGEVWQGDAVGRRKDGRTYDALLTIAPLHDAHGDLAGHISSHRDITRQKELDRARQRFITNVSHQLRTPATNLKLYTQLLRKQRQSDKADDYLQVLEDQSNQLVHLIQNILEMNELDSGQAARNWTPISLPMVVGDTITHYQSQAETSGLALTGTAAPPDLPAVKGDVARLRQALGELVENALSFTPAGGRVTVEAGVVEEEGQRWATIAVRDTGPGISPEEQEWVFDRFFRGRLAESGHVPGTGLGLSIVQEIMRAHGGRVTVESELGRGSTFILWLRSALA